MGKKNVSRAVACRGVSRGDEPCVLPASMRREVILPVARPLCSTVRKSHASRQPASTGLAGYCAGRVDFRRQLPANLGSKSLAQATGHVIRPA